MAGTLYICPTPLGNLGDITLRALDALREARAVYAEDTRVTGKLLALFEIRTHVERCDEASLPARADEIIERVLAGDTVAYCSDAGMPGVSDPGQRLVAAARRAGAPVVVLPGPTAVATAYVASGFTCPRFYFGGFFPRKAGERQRALESLAPLDAALLFYESPNRVAGALETIALAFPQRQVAVCRELTKVHEEVYVASAPRAAEEFSRRKDAGTIKGEIVLVVDAPSAEEHTAAEEGTRTDARRRAEELLHAGSLTKRDIAKQLQREFDIKRNDAYAILLEFT